MSAIFVLPRRDRIDLMSDGAAYLEDGRLTSVTFGKVTTMPTIGAAIGATGPAKGAPIMAAEIVMRFGTFDDLVEEAEDCLPGLFEAIAANTRLGGSSCTLYLAGWLTRANRPGAFCMELATADSLHNIDVMANSSGLTPEFGKLKELADISGTPIPGPELRSAAGFVVPSGDDADPEFHLLHLLEIARREPFKGRFWIGGLALLTTITAEGIEQRVVHRWPEDTVGEFIEPPPIEWRRWRQERLAHHIAAPVPEGETRLKREIRERRARKLARA